MTRRHHFKLHPDSPKSLRKLYRECGRSTAKVAAVLHVNVRHIWQALKFGTIPPNPADAVKLGFERKVRLRRGVDRRRKEVRWFEEREPDQQMIMLEFLYHYKEGEDMPKFEEWRDDLDFGRCCACGTADRSRRIRNIIMLDFKAPVPGTGWGCLQCGLPCDGAAAVVCDRCLETNADIHFAMAGYPAEKRRVSVESLTGRHEHNKSLHPELMVQ